MSLVLGRIADVDQMAEMSLADANTNTGLPVITSVPTEPRSMSLDPVAIDPVTLDASKPETLASRLDAISALSAAGEHVVVTILGNSDAEVAVIASLAVSRGARTLRSVRLTPAIRAALVTAAIMDAD